jgi:hypothetical protein
MSQDVVVFAVNVVPVYLIQSRATGAQSEKALL